MVDQHIFRARRPCDLDNDIWHTKMLDLMMVVVVSLFVLVRVCVVLVV